MSKLQTLEITTDLNQAPIDHMHMNEHNFSELSGGVSIGNDLEN